MTSPRDDTERLFAAVLVWAHAHYPAFHRARLVLEMPDGDKVRLPVMRCAGSEPEPDQSEPFVPNSFQLEILDALDGKALRTDALGHAVNDRSRLFRKPGGIQELKDAGLVAHHARLGFYRPDAPPDQLPV